MTDPAESKPRPQAVPTVQIDNARTVVTQWRFPPGGETGWHRHGMDYTVVPMTTGTLSIESSGGVVRSELVCGQSYHRGAGAEHNVINSNDFEFIFVEIEYR
ncbi:MAG: cupin domain-containing protein [Burkholderiaceae bacterium]|nr:cupin domain-containing protein [Burkholderiaceae bacterium]